LGSTSAQKRPAAERSAAARARIAAGQRRHRLFVVVGGVVAVLAVVAVLVIVRVVTNEGPASGKGATTASAQVLHAVSTVPARVLNEVGVGTASTPPSPIKAPALTANGKPEVLYVGAEYCPYCAAERWAMAVALSRFGTLHGVGEVRSSSTDVYPSTATLSFHGASLRSSLLTFTPKEIQSNQVVNGQYAPLDKLTPAQQAIVTKYNAPPYVSSRGSIPFVDIGGRFVISGASYSPGVLHGKNQAQIAAALSDPSAPITQAVGGTANLITAAICQVTNTRPAAVCTSPGVRAAATKLTSTG
jgi:thiol-disulfide isomerase/thioredoxin